MSQKFSQAIWPSPGSEASKSLIVVGAYTVALLWAMMVGLLVLGGGPGNIFIAVPILATFGLIHVVRKQRKTP